MKSQEEFLADLDYGKTELEEIFTKVFIAVGCISARVHLDCR
jgi:hypothetical protein